MPVLTAGRSMLTLVVGLQLLSTSAGAANMPLPERNPLRVAETMPLPERNPIREAGLPLPERNPNRIAPEAEIADAAPPDEKMDPKAGAKPDDATETKPDPSKWSDEEIAAERARCEVLLKDLPVVTEPDDPVKQGECGAVAPLSLISVGKDPAVRLVPPATVTCDMVAAMAQWIEKDVQPAARKILGAPIARMNIIGHYSCRHALGRTTKRLSEHGVANALDIRDFVTESGETADLTRDWGPTARDIAARIAAEAAAEAARKAAAAASAAAAAEAAERAAKEAKETAPKATQKVAKLAAAKPEPPLPAAMITGTASADAGGRPLSRSQIRRAQREARRRGGPSRMGGRAVSADAGVSRTESSAAAGKKSPAARTASPPPDDEKPSPRRQFLRKIHAKACETFGTVLGPEANEAHRNHFHVDMAKRRYRSYCE